MFKRITSYDYTVTPFQANKRYVVDKDHDYVSTYLGVNTSENRPFYEETAIRNPDEGPYYNNVYELIRHFYYDSDDPFELFGIENHGEVILDRFPTHDYATINVIKVSNQLFGERIFPNSVNIEFSLPDDSFSFTVTDDGNGNLYIEDLDRFVGNVFYQNGVLVFHYEEFYDEDVDDDLFPDSPYDDDDFDEGEYFETGFINFEVPNFEYLVRIFDYELEFRGELTHYEHEVVCTINPHEFNGVTNPSVKSDEEDEEFIPYFRNEATDVDGEIVEFSPFITTVGLYDEFLNLVAVGKLARPIHKPRDIPVSLVVKFDT